MACRQGKAMPASAMRQYGRLRSAVIAVWMASWMMAVLPLASPCGAGEAPVVLHVDDDAPEDGDGLTWATAFTHLRDALHAARLASEAGYPVMEIRVAGGLYKPHLGTPSPLEWPKTFVLVDGTAMRGGYRGAFAGPGDPNQRDYIDFEAHLSGDILGDDGPPHTSTNRGENSTLVVLAQEGAHDVMFEGFAVTNGNVGGNYNSDPYLQYGAAMRCERGSPRITHCRFHDNQAYAYGGLALLRPVDAFVSHCTFTFNGRLFGTYGAGLSMIPMQAEFTNARATIRRCRFEDNRASRGGGLYTGYYAEAEISDCVFLRNRSVEFGGGLNTEASADPLDDDIMIRRCRFEDNISDDTGGAVAYQGRFEDCDFINNLAGGGSAIDLRVSAGGSAITNCRFILNRGVFDGGSAIRGGGIIANCVFRQNTTIDDGTVNVRPNCPALYVNCLFDGNQCTQSTGRPSGATAKIESGANATFVNCTIVNNLSGTGAGGITAHETGSAEVINCILWGNTGAELAGNITATRSCVEGDWPGEGNVSINPQFVDPLGPDGLPGTDDADLRLSIGSPCIDAGDTFALPPDQCDVDGDGNVIEPLPIDLLGQRRVVNDPATPNTGWPAGSPQTLVVDMGAMEYQPERIGDLDGDGNVNVSDVLLLIDAWGACPDPARCAADIAPPTVGDAVVNVDDLLLLINHWG